MTPLLDDRYVVLASDHLLDLATGTTTTRAAAAAAAPSAQPGIATLNDALDAGRDGEPRVLELTCRAWTRLAPVIDRVARDAVTRGYVPIDARLYGRARVLCEDEITVRSLLLLAIGPLAAPAGRRALADASTRSPRPHVLLLIDARRERMPSVVREARPVYGGSRRREPPSPLSVDAQQQLRRAERAETFAREGRHAAAERLLRDVVAALVRRQAWGAAASIGIRLGRLLLDRGRPDEARVVFDAAVPPAKQADDPVLEMHARLWIAVAQVEALRCPAAEAICRAALALEAGDPAVRARATSILTRALLGQGREADAAAVPWLEPPEDLDSGVMAEILAERGRLCIAGGRLFEAGVMVTRLAAIAAGGESERLRLIASIERLRLLTAVGELDAARACLDEVRRLARLCRAPLAALEAWLLWATALRRAMAGNVPSTALSRWHRESPRAARLLARHARVVPPRLRRELESFQGGNSESSCRPGIPLAPRVSPAVWVQLAQSEDEDGDAVRAVLAAVRGSVDGSRIDLWTQDAGPPAIVVSSGEGLPSAIGPRVLDAGIAIGPDVSAGAETGVPVRLGSRLLAALVVRWAAGRQVRSACDQLELAAAIIAPRVDALMHGRRIEATAVLAVPELVGVSAAMADIRRAIARAAAAPFGVLVEGESGVGKELVARALHGLGPRRDRRFCDVNCAALPDDLIESELFGHARGAFSGAVVDRAGLFEDADGGTLFLDEIADLSLRAQAKLLRVLQQQEVRRVGETFGRKIDVRLVAAANRDMRLEAEAGRFRHDLLYRLDVIRLTIPPLRDRPDDVPALARHFWSQASRRVGTRAELTSAAIAVLAAYHWPGNVRQLQNVISALAASAPIRGRIGVRHLPPAITGGVKDPSQRLDDARRSFERRFVELAIARAGGNRARAARSLGVSRQGLLKLLTRVGAA